MWRNIASNALTVAIVVLLGLAGLVGWAKQHYSAPGPLAEAICLKVAKGSNFSRVADDLEAKGAIDWPYIFKVGADYAGQVGEPEGGVLFDRAAKLDGGDCRRGDRDRGNRPAGPRSTTGSG
jgi:UPF0755 protein